MKKYGMNKEEILGAAAEYLDELNKESKDLLNKIHQLQQNYNALQKQIKGLQWFINPQHDEKPIIKEQTQSDAQGIKDAVAEILMATFPASLHYMDIMNQIENKGLVIPGKDPKQNLLSYLSRDERFERGEKRGEYKIVNDYAPSKSELYVTA